MRCVYGIDNRSPVHYARSMRNEPKPLSREAARHAYAMRAALEEMASTHTPVTVTYTKRNGSESSSSGVVQFFNGREGMDTMSVTIDDIRKGPRTINLAGIHRIYEFFQDGGSQR